MKNTIKVLGLGLVVGLSSCSKDVDDVILYEEIQREQVEETMEEETPVVESNTQSETTVVNNHETFIYRNIEIELFDGVEFGNGNISRDDFEQSIDLFFETIEGSIFEESFNEVLETINFDLLSNVNSNNPEMIGDGVYGGADINENRLIMNIQQFDTHSIENFTAVLIHEFAHLIDFEDYGETVFGFSTIEFEPTPFDADGYAPHYKTNSAEFFASLVTRSFGFTGFAGSNHIGEDNPNLIEGWIETLNTIDF